MALTAKHGLGQAPTEVVLDLGRKSIGAGFMWVMGVCRGLGGMNCLCLPLKVVPLILRALIHHGLRSSIELWSRAQEFKRVFEQEVRRLLLLQ